MGEELRPQVSLGQGRTWGLSAAPGALSASLPVGPGLSAGISLAAAGDMALLRPDAQPNRARFIESLGYPPDWVFAFRQVHSRRVLVVDPGMRPARPNAAQPPGPLLPEADGMVSARDDALLTITVADCLPIVLFDSRTGAFGLVHSGWKGTGIVVEALRVMAQSFATRPRDVQVTIGPGIGPCCYTVPQERALAFGAEFGPGCVARGDDRAPRLDLRAANLRLLAEAGVEDVVVVSDCTGCTPALGSFRRQGPGRYTLMLAYVSRGVGDGRAAFHPAHDPC